ncbi:MAG: HAMP domain-containing protein, partial [Chloroflexota bacterium]|nr:HAMP domain-containing protein [Chloroflexota bacterium]
MRSSPRTLPIRRWLVLALVVVFAVPACATATAAATQFRGQWIAQHRATELLQASASQWHDPDWREAMRSELGRQGMAFVLFEGGREWYRSTAEPASGNEWGQRFVQTMTVPGSQPPRTAYVYSDARQLSGAPWLIPVAGLTTLLATLAAIGWLLGRMVLRPLAATSQAARQIASGDLDFDLPPSRVREVAEVSTAFHAMGESLRESLERQAELEEER